MAQQKVQELVEKAASSEQYFTTLPVQTRIEMIAILVVDRILADIDTGDFLLKELKKGDSSHEQSTNKL